MARPLQKSMALPSNVEQQILVEADGCWIWQGKVSDKGYAKANIRDDAGVWRLRNLARTMYSLRVRRLTPDEHLDHLCHTSDPTCAGGPTCRHRRCVNPAHLEPVTMQENTRRARSTITAANKRRGYERTHCKNGHELTPDNVKFFAKFPDRRRCRTCANDRNRQWQREHYRRKSEAAS